MTYLLEVHEDGHRIPVGDPRGYRTLKEAKEIALRKVDDAMPNNAVVVMKVIGHTAFGGDGVPYYRKAE